MCFKSYLYAIAKIAYIRNPKVLYKILPKAGQFNAHNGQKTCIFNQKDAF